MQQPFDILREPDLTEVLGASGPVTASLHTDLAEGRLTVFLEAPGQEVSFVRLRWRHTLSCPIAILGDHWERGYGDLEWRGIVPERRMPWYFVASTGHETAGAGVMTGSVSIAWWQVDTGGVTLWLDVRNGGRPVQLGDRRLHVATVVQVQGGSPFETTGQLCQAMCPTPRLPSGPVYGINDWYFAYGSSTADSILRDTRTLVELAPPGGVRPYSVIDDGWQVGPATCGPWTGGNAKFPDVAGLARQIKDLGARPGIWIRPLYTSESVPDHWVLKPGANPGAVVLDPSVPEVLERVREDMARLVGWGYELVKHDFTTYDLFGKWGFEMDRDVTHSGWGFADRSRTTAEIITDLYRAIREGAGNAVVLGCNTIGHLSAGLFELQRTGDDTSGREWDRTRKMGVNTLAFRMPQHGKFFAVDADCVGLTNRVPWSLTRQWLDLLARSGTPLFVSAAPEALGEEQREALRQAYAVAATERPVAQPLDWSSTTCPAQWRFVEGEQTFDWYGDRGAMAHGP
jgi:alpha-galactosidase